MLAETSTALVDVVEHPTRVPTIATASKYKHGLSVFILLLRSPTIKMTSSRGRAATPHPLLRRIFSPRGLDSIQNRKAKEHNCTDCDPMRGDMQYHGSID